MKSGHLQARAFARVPDSRQAGFTLVEMLVAFALVLFILVILTEAFGAALRAFRELKAVGDLEGRLRGVAAMLRRDLAADHFEGRRRLSDPPASWAGPDVPREGFFRVAERSGAGPDSEGTDADGIPFRRRSDQVLHFSVKLRGNGREDFFAATRLPANSPLFTRATTFFGHPPDARYMESNDRIHKSQWAEVAYFLEPNGAATADTPLFGLYRTQYVVVADNRHNDLNNVAANQRNDYAEVSCQADRSNKLHFNTPGDLALGSFQYPRWVDAGRPTFPRRAFDPTQPTPLGAALLLTDVVSFDVQVLPAGETEFRDFLFDTAEGRPVVSALRVQVRIWDMKTRQSRQLTFIQDM